jgi:hypothetical protein
MAGTTAFADAEPQYDADFVAGRLDKFCGAESSATEPLAAAERARIDVLAADLDALLAQERKGLAGRQGFLHATFAGFETLWGSRSGFLRRLVRMLAGTGRWAAQRLSGTHPTEHPAPGDFARDYAVFDRLSTWYGGQYRGAIVFSYRLAILSVLCAALSRLVPESDSALAFAFGGAEIVILLLIFGLYLIGRTRDQRLRRGGRSGWINRCWRQRWLEYRLLAERFRYADLLRVSGIPLVQAWGQLLASHPGAHWLERHTRKPGEYWHERFFLARVAEAPSRTLEAGFTAEFKRVLAEQYDYHGRVARRRGRIARRLHKLATWFFVGALVLTALHVGLLAFAAWPWLAEVLPDVDFEQLHHGSRGAIVLCSSVLTGAAAAIHGTLATGEYTKLTDISREMVSELEVLAEATEQKLAAGADVTALAPEIEAFCRLVTEDATGWTLLLRDKDLPRGGH